MAKKLLKEEEYLEVLFDSSDEEEPTITTSEADHVFADMFDESNWDHEEIEGGEPEEEVAVVTDDLAFSHAVGFSSLPQGLPIALTRPSKVRRRRSSPAPGPSSEVSLFPSGSAVPPSGSAVPPSGSAVPLSGSAVPPSGSAVPLSGSAVPPSVSTVPPSGSAVPPSGSAVPPSGSAVPLSGSAVPPSVSAVPPSGSAVPPSGSAVPPSGSAVPPSGSAVPPSGSAVPPSGSAVPPSGSAVPPSGSAVPPSGSAVATVPIISTVELKSRKRMRGPLCPAVGLELKKLPEKIYTAKDRTKWRSEPNSRMPPIVNIKHFDTVGPTLNVIGCKTPAEVFSKFLPDALLAEVVVHTNDKILMLRNKVKRQDDPTFKDLSLMEFRAFLGILVMTGARKDNHLTLEDMFSRSQGCPYYRSVMSERRFAFILRALRFDSLATREERVKKDKFTAIRSLWEQVIANCIANYEPSGHLTVDEQLLAFRGRCGFRMYIPNKPAKYGIKLVMLCDADTYYMCNAIPYLGKGTAPTKTPLGEYFTMELTRPYRKSGRIITTDNWFTSLPLAKSLRQVGMHLVGTIRPKPYLPIVMLTTPLELGECVASYNYEDKVTLLAQKVKSTKRIQLLSTVHHNPTVIEINKSHIHMYYNATKGGVDTFDQICSALTCSRKTRRWPLCLFYGIMNIVVNNSFYIHQNLPGNKIFIRRDYSIDLAKELARDWAFTRLGQKRFLPRDVCYLICSVFDVQEPADEFEDAPKLSEKRQRCPLCPQTSNKRTKLLCTKCGKPTCNSHVNYVCDGCHHP